MRSSEINRKTKETDIALKLCLDGGDVKISTGIGFFDHMLNSFAVHGGFGLEATVDGDLCVDGHHSVEDLGIVLGQAFSAALGDKSRIARFASFFAPMDESLAFAAVDISGRPYLVFNAVFTEATVGNFDTCLCEEFFRAFAFNAGITLHLELKYGANAHHGIEALFKATAHTLRAAVREEYDGVLSTKGTLS